MTKHKTRKINIAYRSSKRRQRCEIDSWWQTGSIDLSLAQYKSSAAHYWYIEA